MRTLFVVTCAALLAAMLPVPAAALVDVAADFEGGNSTGVPDAYLGMAGAGWTGPWAAYLSNSYGTPQPKVLTSADLDYLGPLGDGTGNYLNVKANFKAPSSDVSYVSIGRNYAGELGIDLTTPYTIDFLYRVDRDLTGTFASDADRYEIFDHPLSSNGNPRGGPLSTSTWIIGAYGAGGTTWLNTADAGYWVFYNGLGAQGNNGLLAAQQVNTGISIHNGVTYSFHVEVDPVNKLWNASVSDGLDSFSASNLGWRLNTDELSGGNPNATTAGTTQFCVRGDAANDDANFSIDAYHIQQNRTFNIGGMNQVVARFDGGNSTTVVDGYKGMAGSGWNSPWTAKTGNGVFAATAMTDLDLDYQEIKPGQSGAYLRATLNGPTGSSVAYGNVIRDYTRVNEPGIDWTQQHTIQFTVRVDEDVVNGLAFSNYNDRYQIFDAPSELSGTNATCTWMISAVGGTDPSSVFGPEVVGQWSFYNGSGDGTVDILRNVDTNIDLVQNGVYDFTLVIDPETKTYDATVSMVGGESYSAENLGWRSATDYIGGLLHFVARADAADDVRAWSIDELVITQSSAERLPGDADNNGVVNSADAAILAGHWLEDVGAGGPDSGDFNGDGRVNDLDASILAAHWQYGTTSAAVPEPGTWILLLSCLAGLVGLKGVRRK